MRAKPDARRQITIARLPPTRPIAAAVKAAGPVMRTGQAATDRYERGAVPGQQRQAAGKAKRYTGGRYDRVLPKKPEIGRECRRCNHDPEELQGGNHVVNSDGTEVETGKTGEIGCPSAPARHQPREQDPGKSGRALALARLRQDARGNPEAEHGQCGGYHDRKGILLSDKRPGHATFSNTCRTKMVWKGLTIPEPLGRDFTTIPVRAAAAEPQMGPVFGQTHSHHP